MRFLLLLLCVLLPSFSFAESKPTTFNLSSEEWVDYSNTDGSGYYFDLYRMIYQPEGVELVIAVGSYDRGVNAVKLQRADGWIGAYWEDVDFALYPDQEKHLGYDQVVVVTPKGKGLDSMDALAGKTLGWMKGYGFEGSLKIKVKDYEVKDRQTGIKLVQAGRLDGFLDSRDEIEEAFAEGTYNIDEFEIHDIFKLYLYPAFVKSAKGEQLRDIWNRRYEALKDNPEFIALMEEL
jgi:polar amino acid transport system substrate-binding protein